MLVGMHCGNGYAWLLYCKFFKMMLCAIPLVHTNEKATCAKLLFPKRNMCKQGRFASIDAVIYMSGWKTMSVS